MEGDIKFVDGPEVALVDRRAKVWLDCSGEPCDFRSVNVVGIRTIAERRRYVSA